MKVVCTCGVAKPGEATEIVPAHRWLHLASCPHSPAHVGEAERRAVQAGAEKLARDVGAMKDAAIEGLSIVRDGVRAARTVKDALGVLKGEVVQAVKTIAEEARKGRGTP